MNDLIGRLWNKSQRRPAASRMMAGLLATGLGALLVSSPGHAQGLTVLPVTMQLAPGQTAVAFTVINQTESETSFQIRGFAWKQVDGTDQLLPTDELLTSPPLGTIPANASQVVRIEVRHAPEAREVSYRILLDQIPPPADPGTVRVALRLSIPVFAEPQARIAPHVKWRIERSGSDSDLVAINDGNRHETVRDIVLTVADGSSQKVGVNVSPYILPGATRRWRLPALASAMGTSLRLTARADSGALDQPVTVVAAK